MLEPVVLILNPSAGTLQFSGASDRVKTALDEAGLQVDTWVVGAADGPAALARKALRAGFKTIVAAGGDGTVSAVASELAGRPEVLGVLPVGTLNHFAKDLHIPLDIESAIRVLQKGVVARVDVGQVNGRNFINNSSVGLYPRLVRLREKNQRRFGLGKWRALFWAGLEVFRWFPFSDVRLHAEGVELRRQTPFVFVGNNMYQLEGLRMGSREVLTRGELCIAVGHRIGRWGIVKLAVRAFLGNLSTARDFDVFAVPDVLVETRRSKLLVSLDGEVVVMRSPLHYRTWQAALNVLVAPGEQSE